MTFRAALLLFAAAFVLAGVHAAEESPPTVISSDSGEMVSSDNETTFTFRNHVVVTGTNIRITCDQLVVVANRTGDTKATIGRQDRFKSLVATGHVRIVQSDREAVCERAEVFPGEDKVVLTGNPSVRSLDGQYRADGPRLVLYRGQRRAVIEGGPTERARITLPPLKDLGYGKELEKEPKTPEHEATPAPQK
ncbi:MAG TPA: LptA/OstA family protein [Opitutaceae bacterium]|nr:LptA/OstA family protein [Opitutaceae bacterium]